MLKTFKEINNFYLFGYDDVVKEFENGDIEMSKYTALSGKILDLNNIYISCYNHYIGCSSNQQLPEEKFCNYCDEKLKNGLKKEI